MNMRWLPNSITLGNLSMGFFSVVLTMNAQINPQNFYKPFFLSGLLVVITSLTDGLDGATARLLKVQSSIGEQLDSLADMVTFGVAPAVLMYKMFLSEFYWTVGTMQFPVGLLIAAIFPMSAAYRLARFNTGHLPDSFVGLPSPVAGGLIAIIPVYASYGAPVPPVGFLIFLYFLLAFLMISYIQYIKPQSAIKFRFHPFKIILFFLIPLLIAIFFVNWSVLLSMIAVIYISSGLIGFGIMIIQKMRVRLSDDE